MDVACASAVVLAADGAALAATMLKPSAEVEGLELEVTAVDPPMTTSKVGCAVT